MCELKSRPIFSGNDCLTPHEQNELVEDFGLVIDDMDVIAALTYDEWGEIVSMREKQLSYGT